MAPMAATRTLTSCTGSAAVVVAVGLAVAVVESFGDVAKGRRVERAGRNGDGELVGLALVARIDGALEAPALRRHAGTLEHRRALALQGGEGGLQGGGIGGSSIGVDRAHVVALQVGAHEPERGERARDRRADDLGHAELGRECRGVQRPGAAEGREGELARVVAALHRHDLQGFRHRVVDHVDDGRSRGADIDAQGLGKALGDGRFGGGVIDGEIAAKQRALVEVAEQQVAVGHRGLGPAAAVADGAGVGAGAPGADAQGPSAVHPGDGAAAGGHLGEIDDRHADRVAGAVHPAVGAGAAADLVLRRRLVLAVADQARLGGGAAHVEGNEVGAAGLPGHQRCRDDAGRRARFDGHGRHRHGLGSLQDAAVRCHHVERRQLLGTRGPFQALQIRREDRADVGAHGRGAGALVLLDLGQHLAGEVDRDAGQGGAQASAQPALVVGIEEAEEQRDGDGLDARRLQFSDQSVDLQFGERRDDGAVGADTLGDLEAAPARDERGRRILEQVVEVGAGGAPELQNVAEAAGGDERRAGALLLQDGVGDDGGGV